MTVETSIPFDEISKEVLSDPETAAMYLEEILEDGDIELFKAALKDVAAAGVDSVTVLDDWGITERNYVSRVSLVGGLTGSCPNRAG